MRVFECGKCGKQFNSSLENPRCTDRACSSTKTVMLEEEKQHVPTDKMTQFLERLMERVEEKIEEKKKTMASDNEFDAELVTIARRMGKIYALNALGQGKMLDVEGKHANIISDVLTSLKESNENMADSLAQRSEIAADQRNELDQTKNEDPISQILEFAKNNPELAKQAAESLLKKRSEE